MKIVVLDGYTLNPGDNPWDGVAALGDLSVHDRSPQDQIISRATEAGIILTNKTPLSRETIESLPSLKFISVLATGYNVVDVKAAAERGIPVSNVPTYGTDSVAQHTFALILELCQNAGLHNQSVQDGDWTRSPDFCYWKLPMVELAGKTIGIVGFGRIGQRVAEIARTFGMQVIYLQRPGSTHSNPGARGVSLDELAARSDFISLHCALTPENTGFVDRSFLSKIKPTAFLINTSRGALINEADLAEALHKGTFAGAALDVLSEEPPPPDHPLFHVPRCIITPHLAWAGPGARRNLMKTTVENVRSFLGGKPVNVVNATLLEK